MKLYDRFKRLRRQHQRRSRLLFPSPAEMRLLRVMGGLYIKLPVWSLRNHYPMVIVLWRGWTFMRYGIRREVIVSGYHIDFANQTHGIEVDGRAYHTDWQHDQARDRHIAKRGVRVLRLKGHEIYRNPKLVKRTVKKWLKSK